MRVFRWIGVVLLALVIAWGLGATWTHLRGPDARQAAALATLAKVPAAMASERNVADDARLLGHDVPAERREAALATVRRADARRIEYLKRGDTERWMDPPDPLAGYPAYPHAAPSPVLCDARGTGCLAHVRADLATTQALLDKHARELQATLALADNDGYRLDRAPSMYAPFASMGSDNRRLVLTAFAARFAEGDTAGALGSVCDDLAGWRRIGANSDQLIAMMLSDIHVEQDATLLAQLVAALPAGQALPSECAAALAPTTDAELDLCPAMVGEFALMRSAATMEPQPDTGLVDQLLLRGVDSERMAYLMAPHYATFCGEPALAQARADRRFDAPTVPPSTCPRWEFLFDPIDCILVDISISGGTAFPRYFDRRTDTAATLALLRTAVWLRETDTDPRPREQRLRERPASLGLRRDVKLEGDALVIDRHDARGERTLSLPLAPRTAAVATAP
jgi:hypothetical protein